MGSASVVAKLAFWVVYEELIEKSESQRDAGQGGPSQKVASISPKTRRS